MARFLAGELDVKGTMKNIVDTWNELGKPKQQAA